MGLDNPRTLAKVMIHREWRKLANLPAGDIQILLNSKEGKKAADRMFYVPGIGKRKAGIILRRLIRMRRHGFHTWTTYDWLIAKAQVENIKRCMAYKGDFLKPRKKGVKGPRKATSKYINCLLWGGDPRRKPGASFKRHLTIDRAS